MTSQGREARPAPPPGVSVLTVPEAVDFARQAASRRGDQKALLMQQDVRKDIQAGRLPVGTDAFWVQVQAHPKGGFWVVTVQAIERRIQERLRGRGRPPKGSDTRVEEEAATPPKGETERLQPAPQAMPTLPPAPAADPHHPMVLQAEVEESGDANEQPASIAVVSGDRAYEAFPVADPEQYRWALAEVIKVRGQQNSLFYICRCGWAGQDSNMTWVPYEDGRGKHATCPQCGRHRQRQDMGYTSAVARELPWLQRLVREDAGRTRNEKWATTMRKHLRHLELLARQADLDEPVTPGVKTGVAALIDQVRRLLDESQILPAAMRTEPGSADVDTLAVPLVRLAMEHLDLFRFDGPVVEEILGAVQSGGAVVFSRAVLDRRIPWQAVWSTLRWLAAQGAGRPDLEYPARLMDLLSQVPARDLEEARLVYHQVRRWGKDFYTAGEDWARENYGTNRHRWQMHRSTAEMFHHLLGNVETLLMKAARERVQAQVEDEVDRLAGLADAEAERTGHSPLQVVATWVRSRGKKHFASAELMRLAAYPLAQRLAGHGAKPGR